MTKTHQRSSRPKTPRSQAAAAKPRGASRVGAYLKKIAPAVREHFAEASDLPTFLESAGTLTPDQRALVVRQALILIEQNYAHLPLKRAMHAVDPVQRLRLLLQRIESTPAAGQMPESEFHREMTDIFTSVRDLHTNYLLPSPFNAMTAFLPFMVEDYFENGKRKYLVSHVANGFSHPTFVPGVEVLSWSGVPIERAVLNQAQRYAGSNPEARHARGVQTLTSRALILSAPPDEEWVIVGYRTLTGAEEEIRLDWVVNPPPPSGVAAATAEEGADPKTEAALGLDLEQEIIQRVRKALFAPQVIAAEKKALAKMARQGTFSGLDSSLPGVFEARPVTTPHGTFGYLRIRTFNVGDIEEFVDEFIRLISELPRNGLIIDVRGNGGGVIMNGELILQTLTPRPIDPEPVQFLNTSLNLEMCRRNGPTSPVVDLSAWVESMQQALQTGAMHSAGFPISDREACNAIGQKYFGPVVLITDALCYSTTDIFSAGFQDHEIGPVLGVDNNTGAGGANVWTHSLLQTIFSGTGSPYLPLPNGTSMRVSIRRTLRVGRRSGAPVEDLGVVPDVRHLMTRDDLLNANVDLIHKAASLLAARPPRDLNVEIEALSATQIKVTAKAQGMTRLDFYLNGRPIESVDLAAGQAIVTLTKPTANAILEIQGFDAAQLVARFRTPV